MKVLLISHQFPSPQIPYRGRFVEDQVLATIPFGVEFFVLQVEPDGFRIGNIPNFLKAIWFGLILGRSVPLRVKGEPMGVQLYSPGIRLGGGVQAMVNSMVALRWALKNDWLKTFDCFHAHTGLSDGLIAFVLSRFSGKRPYLITEHSGPYEMLFKGVGGKLIAGIAIRHAEVFVAVSSFLKSCILRHFPSRDIEVVGNAYDSNVFHNAEFSGHPSRPTVLWIGHLSPKKNIGLAFQTLAELRKLKIDGFLRVLTSSKLDAGAEKQLQQSGMQDFVSFVRAETREDVAAELRRASSLLVTSEVETFSVTTLEALATGLPVVSTNCGGPVDLIVHPDDGVLDLSGRPASLAAALKAVIENDSSEQRQQRAERAKFKFGPAAIGAWYSNKYRQICNQL